VSKVTSARRGAAAIIAGLDHALGALMRPVVKIMPRRLRRIAERIERQRTRPLGQMAAVTFLLAAVLYGLIVGGQLGRLGDAMLVVAGFGIENIEINGYKETPELAILEKLEIGGSLVGYDVAEAQDRIATLPWVARATVRKFYPSTLSVEIEEREPFALWQRQGQVFVIDRGGTEIVSLEESRFGKLPFMVGEGANQRVGDFLADINAEPDIAAQMRAAVLVAGRRWDLHLEDGVTVKLPEKNIRAALAQLVRLNAERQLLQRDVIVIDLRLPDRVTVRLPEGRSLEDVTSDGAGDTPGAKART
jgi:cell division protein FtsQ